MKRILASIFILITITLFLGACSNEAKQSSNSDDRTVEQKVDSGENKSQNKADDNTEDSLDEAETNDNPENTPAEAEPDVSEEVPSKADKNEDSNNQANDIDGSALSEYPAEEIEFARVWLQIIGNQDVEELNVYHISAGEQVNPYDDHSVDYPEDVITLGGGIMADGIVTYSGNGDGTINLYNIPSHWPSKEQIDTSMEEYTDDIIENTEQIYIETGNDEEVITLIEKLNIQS